MSKFVGWYLGNDFAKSCVKTNWSLFYVPMWTCFLWNEHNVGLIEEI
jgi:hypothetical protein